MSEQRFIDLVETHQGFEFCQAYRNDLDHIIGGKGNTFWYIILKKGRVTESWIATLENGLWNDHYSKGKSAPKALPSGSTIKRIAEQAYLKQGESWVKGRKARLIDDTYLHYVRGFGEEALDVSEKYGVTVGYNKIDDVSVGFHLRYLYMGADVEMP